MYLRRVYLYTAIIILWSELLFPLSSTAKTIVKKEDLTNYCPISLKQVESAKGGNLPSVYNEESLKTYQNLLKLAREIHDSRLEGMALVSIGITYLFQEKFSLAIENLEPGLAITRKVGDRLSEKQALLNLATAHFQIGNFDKTTQFAQELLALAEEENDLARKADALQALGAAEFARKNYTEAIRYHEQSWKISQKIKDPEREAIILGALGEAYIAAGDAKTGTEYLERSQAISQRSQQAAEDSKLAIQPNDSWNIVVAKAISLRQLGRIDEAVIAFARYGEMFASTDPTAKLYSLVAQKFTKQIKSLGVKGGVYIYELVNPLLSL